MCVVCIVRPDVYKLCSVDIYLAFLLKNVYVNICCIVVNHCYRFTCVYCALQSCIVTIVENVERRK